ncbi:hypothetical protein ACTHQX_00325 [Arthrobacter sp. SAFR-023]
MKRVLATAALVGVGLLGTSLPAALAQSGDDSGGSGQNCQVSGSDDDFSALTVSIQRSSGGSDDDCGNEGPDDNQGPGDNQGTGGNEGPGGGHEEPPYEEPPYEEPPVEQPPAEQPPVEQPPAEQPPAEQQPVVKPPAVTPVVKPVVKPQAVKPVVAAPAQPAPAVAAVVPPAPNAGFNVQTAAAAGSQPDAGIPAWLAAMTGLFTALTAGVLVKSGVRARKHKA